MRCRWRRKLKQPWEAVARLAHRRRWTALASRCATSGPADSRHINLWLADNCFGDYYTRTGLDLRMRELITFCFLAAQGGCEPQLKGHIAGNYHVGNDKDFLIAVLSNNLPFIGYPRTLNALNCIREVAEPGKKK